MTGNSHSRHGSTLRGSKRWVVRKLHQAIESLENRALLSASFTYSSTQTIGLTSPLSASDDWDACAAVSRVGSFHEFRLLA